MAPGSRLRVIDYFAKEEFNQSMPDLLTLCPCGGDLLALPIYQASTAGLKFGLRPCTRCGRKVLDPRPSASELGAWYGRGYFGAGSTKFVGPIENYVALFRRSRARLAARLLGQPGDGSLAGRRVLDVGCGAGQFLAALAARGCECHGTELSAETAVRAAGVAGIRLHVGPIDASTYPEGIFDLISAWHVLEHLSDPDATLRNCRRWIREGGTLMVAVPNIDSWQARLFRGYWFHLDPPRHLFHFGVASLRTALQEAGFRIVRIRHLSWEHNLFGMLQSALNSLGIPRDDIHEVLKGNRRIGSHWGDLVAGMIFALGIVPAAAFAIAEAVFRAGGTLECVVVATPFVNSTEQETA